MRLVVAVLLLFACTPPHESAPPAPRPKPAPRPVVRQLEEFSGTFMVGDERNAFEPCGKNEAWWIEFSPDARQTLEADKISGWGSWPIRVRGTLSPEGHYGHLGAYSRQLHVEQVIATGRRAPC